MRLIDILAKKDKRGLHLDIRENLKGSSKPSEISYVEEQYPHSCSKKNRQSKVECIEIKKAFLLKKLIKDKKRISIKNLVINLIVLS